jgi:hypothetical protein
MCHELNVVVVAPANAKAMLRPLVALVSSDREIKMPESFIRHQTPPAEQPQHRFSNSLGPGLDGT